MRPGAASGGAPPAATYAEKVRARGGWVPKAPPDPMPPPGPPPTDPDPQRTMWLRRLICSVSALARLFNPLVEAAINKVQMDVYAYGSALKTMAECYVPEGCFVLSIKQLLGLATDPVAGKPDVPWMGCPPNVPVGQRWEHTPFLLAGDEGMLLSSSKGRTNIGPTMRQFYYWNLEFDTFANDSLTNIATAILNYGNRQQGAAFGDEEEVEGGAASGGAALRCCFWRRGPRCCFWRRVQRCCSWRRRPASAGGPRRRPFARRR